VALRKSPCFGEYHTKKNDWRGMQKLNTSPYVYPNVPHKKLSCNIIYTDVKKWIYIACIFALYPLKGLPECGWNLNALLPAEGLFVDVVYLKRNTKLKYLLVNKTLQMLASQNTCTDLTLGLGLCLFPLCLSELEAEKHQCHGAHNWMM